MTALPLMPVLRFKFRFGPDMRIGAFHRVWVAYALCRRLEIVFPSIGFVLLPQLSQPAGLCICLFSLPYGLLSAPHGFFLSFPLGLLQLTPALCVGLHLRVSSRHFLSRFVGRLLKPHVLDSLPREHRRECPYEDPEGRFQNVFHISSLFPQGSPVSPLPREFTGALLRAV